MGNAFVSLNGHQQQLDPNFAEFARQFYPQPQFVGETQEQFWQKWTMRSFQNGERLVHITSEEDLNAAQYHNGEGIDVGMLAEWGEVRLQPALTQSYIVSSANLPLAVSSNGTYVVAGQTDTPFIKYWDIVNGWQSAGSVAGSGAVKDIIVAGSTMYAVRGTGVLTSTAVATWTTVGSYNTAVGVAYLNGDLIVGKSDGIYNHTQSEAISTIGCSAICSYRESLYWGIDRRLYRYDGRASYLYDELPQGFIITALIPYRMVMLILGYYQIDTGYKGAVYYLFTGTENHLYSLGDYSGNHRIYAACGSDDELFIASPDRGGADRYDLAQGGLAAGPALGTAIHTPFKSMAFCQGRLFVGRYDGDLGTDGIYMADCSNPTTYRASGWFTTPEYDFGYAEEGKVVKSIGVEHRKLQAGEEIKVEYSTDGGSLYKLAGSSNITGSDSHSWFPESLTFRNLKLRVTLTAGAGAATSPTLLTVRVAAAPVSSAKYMWDLRLVFYKSHQGEKRIADLVQAHATGAPMLFTDLDGSVTTVIVDDFKILNRGSDPDTGTGLVRLRQV